MMGKKQKNCQTVEKNMKQNWVKFLIKMNKNGLRQSNKQQTADQKTENWYQSPNLCWVMEELRWN
jgi:ATP adenylyltransferase/5',5'''-P-1,P-4-tetraphosphate phosphorylase II